MGGERGEIGRGIVEPLGACSPAHQPGTSMGTAAFPKHQHFPTFRRATDPWERIYYSHLINWQLRQKVAKCHNCAELLWERLFFIPYFRTYLARASTVPGNLLAHRCWTKQIWYLSSRNGGWDGTSLVVQWLRLHLPMQGVWVQSLVGELRSHMLLGQKTKT